MARFFQPERFETQSERIEAHNRLMELARQCQERNALVRFIEMLRQASITE